MCGIFGLVSKKNKFDFNTIKEAVDTLSHRGPDDWGVEKFEIGEWDIWLGHRRLSILDLTDQGHQPMNHEENGRVLHSVVYNGEAYNYKDLKKEYQKKWGFQTKSDTEVILAGLVQSGESSIKHINGMFALGFLDISQKTLLLARDRVGKKPLYIYRSNTLIAFASELKPFFNLKLPLTIDPTSMHYYHWLGYIPAQMTVYKECQKLSAASSLSVDLSKDHLTNIKEESYWDSFVGYGRKYSGSYENALEEFMFLLDDATKIRLEADVPIGCFLSGGIDSSLVISSIKKLGKEDVRAFTVKFDDPNFDESNVAIQTSKQINFPLEVIHLKASEYEKQIAKISYFYDEPFSDSSQIATMAIAEAARKHIKVVLTGDGGDEVFLGYPRYSYINKLEVISKIQNNFPFLKSIMLKFLSIGLGKLFFKILLRIFGVSQTNLDSKLFRAKEILQAHDKFDFYDSILSTNLKSSSPHHVKEILEQNYYELTKSFYPKYNWEFLNERATEEKLGALDLISYMKDDVLVKVDRATMAYSLEARSPLLDYRIIEFGTSLPLHFKIKDGIYKRILRDALSTRLKGNITRLPKMGFGVPLPSNLPPGPTMASRWNTFIENQWKDNYKIAR